VYCVELSEVLWHFFMQIPMSMHGIEHVRWVFVVCAWSIWAILTVVILLLMEGLSAFLHTLRLHWSVSLTVLCGCLVCYMLMMMMMMIRKVMFARSYS